MRISPSDIRHAIADSSYRIPPQRPAAPSADGTLRKAIRDYHQHGVEAASVSFESGLSSEYWRDKGGLTKAKMARELLDTYIHLAEQDPRVAVPATSHTIRWRGHDIAASVDLLVRDPRGHVGRICFTAAVGRLLTEDERALIAAAPLQGLRDEFEGQLFDNVIAEIEIWELRLNAATTVSRDRAEAAWPRLLEHIQRAVS